MGNIDNLYRTVIMDHYKNPHNKGLVENDDSYQTVHLNNPSCGDDIFIQIQMKDGKLSDVRHNGHGCSICCSSASVMSDSIKGTEKKEALAIIDNFLTMIKGEDYNDDIDMGDAVVYQGVSQFPARIKCATLAWKAALKALVGEGDE